MTFGDFADSSPLSLSIETFLLITQLLHANLFARGRDIPFYVTMFQKGHTKTYTLSFDQGLTGGGYNDKLVNVSECEQMFTSGKKNWSYAYGVQYYEAYANGKVTAIDWDIQPANFDATFTYDNTKKILEIHDIDVENDDMCQLKGTLRGLNLISLLTYPLPSFITNSFEKYSIPHLLKLHQEAGLDTTLLKRHVTPPAFNLHTEKAEPFYWKFVREEPPEGADAGEDGKYKLPQKAKHVLMKRFNERIDIYGMEGIKFRVNIYQAITWELIHGISQLQSDPYRLLEAMLKSFVTLRSEAATHIEMMLMKDEFREYRELIAVHKTQVQGRILRSLGNRTVSDRELARNLAELTIGQARLPVHVHPIREAYEHAVREKRLEMKQCESEMVSLFQKWRHDCPIQRTMSLGMKALINSWNGDTFFADMPIYKFVPMPSGRNHDNVASAILRCAQDQRIVQLTFYASLPRTYLTFLILELQIMSIFNFYNDMPLHYVMFGKYGSGKSFVLGAFLKASIPDMVVFKSAMNSGKAWTARIQLDNYTLTMYGELPAVLTKTESSVSDSAAQEKITGLKCSTGGEPRAYTWLAMRKNVFQDPSTKQTHKTECREQQSRTVVERNAMAAAGNLVIARAEDGALKNRFICDSCPLHNSDDDEGEGEGLPPDDLNTWVVCRGVITQLNDDIVNKEALMSNRLRLSQCVCCHFFLVSSLGILSRQQPWTDALTKLIARNFIDNVKREMICADVSVRGLKDKLLTTVTSVTVIRVVQELFMFPESKYRRMLNEKVLPNIMDVCRDIHIRAWSTVQDFVTAALLMLPLWIREVEQVFSKKLLAELSLNNLNGILENGKINLRALQRRLDAHGHSFKITSSGKLDPNFIVLDTGMRSWKYEHTLAIQLGMSKDEVKGILRRFGQQPISGSTYKQWDPKPPPRPTEGENDDQQGSGFAIPGQQTGAVRREGQSGSRRRRSMVDSFNPPGNGVLSIPARKSAPFLSTVEGSNGFLKIEICTHALPRLQRMAHVSIINRMEALIQKTLRAGFLTGKPIYMFAGQERRTVRINHGVHSVDIPDRLTFRNSFNRNSEWKELLRASSTSAKDLGPWCKDLLQQFVGDNGYIEIKHDPDVLSQRLHFERFNFRPEEHRALFEERRPFIELE